MFFRFISAVHPGLLPSCRFARELLFSFTLLLVELALLGLLLGPNFVLGRLFFRGELLFSSFLFG